MSDWASDIACMHDKFGVHDWFEKNKDDKELMKKYLNFRLNMCLEELLETAAASDFKLTIGLGEVVFTGDGKDIDPEEIVDGLVDLCVFAIGTLDVFGVDANEAWNRVYNANMAKNVGVKEGRPNPFGLPDLIKPEGWVAPSHEGNHGQLELAL
jgi:predicted HAD superfamily Cof-like phosphohydrolase